MRNSLVFICKYPGPENDKILTIYDRMIEYGDTQILPIMDNILFVDAILFPPGYRGYRDTNLEVIYKENGIKKYMHIPLEW